MPKSKQYPMDYFVPNFGMDHDIANTMKHTSDTEKKYGTWDIDLKKKEEPPRDYPVANFGVDRDISDSLKHMSDQEAIHGTWTPVEDIQTLNDLRMRSDPICDSSGCNQYLHPKKETWPMNYFVPDFGIDHDIVDSQQHEKSAEVNIGHNWLMGTHADIRMMSDPICDSSGCNQYKHPKVKDAYPVDYPVPDFGVDEDIAWA